MTLVELVVVAAVAAVLLSAAMPGLRAWVVREQLVAVLSEYVASLRLARSEAIRANGRSVLCKSADGRICASQGGWEQGWIVFHDRNHNAQIDPEDVVVERHGPIAPGWRFFGNSPVAHYVSYRELGASQMVTGALQAGTLTLCPPPGIGIRPRSVVLSAMGRVRTEVASPSDCA